MQTGADFPMRSEHVDVFSLATRCARAPAPLVSTHGLAPSIYTEVFMSGHLILQVISKTSQRGAAYRA